MEAVHLAMVPSSVMSPVCSPGLALGFVCRDRQPWDVLGLSHKEHLVEM